MSSVCNIRGIPISFPFEPYDLQKEYMDKVIQCLQNNQNGVLESPTGTGKTLSLLCSSLAWLTMKKAQMQEQWIQESYGAGGKILPDIKSEGSADLGQDMRSKESFFGVPKIIYASRTHTQLSQAMQELKRTAYAHVSSTVLGGRDQLCVHQEIMNETNNAVKTAMCNIKVKSRSCQFYNRTEKVKDDPQVKNIMDIEDLVLEGNKRKFCPYYMTRELHKKADIIFMPYNYLLDVKIRKSFGISLTNCVVILDEAHNIERICEESASIQIKNVDIALCIDEVTTVMKALSEDSEDSFLTAAASEGLRDFSPNDLCLLKEVLLKFETVFDAIEIKNSEKGVTFPGDYIFEIMDKSNINNGNQTIVINLIDKIVQFLSTLNSGPMQRSGTGLTKLQNFLELVFAGGGQQYIEKVRKCYKVHIAIENKGENQNKRNTWMSKHQNDNGSERVLSFWCFSPGFGMNMLMDQNLKCLILTSGTLAPLKPLISELELKVDVRLENSHIVKSDQVCVKIVSKGPDLQLLSSAFNNRYNVQYIASLARTIQNICRVLPSGLLIFFPSYTVLNLCENTWKQSGQWAAISNIKAIFVEPRAKGAFRQAMDDYYNKINDPKFGAAIFMGVCRGKVSEGLDFADANGRGVIITGLPYPPFSDPKIVLKRAYLNECKKIDKDYLSGQEWYDLEAYRAVNQAIGRVIRHRYDYGIILLLDSRFAGIGIKQYLSKWLQDKIETVENFGQLIASTKKFFVEANKNYPIKKNEPQTQKEKVPSMFTYTQDLSDSVQCSTSNVVNAANVAPIQSKKRRKIVITSNVPQQDIGIDNRTQIFIEMLKRQLSEEDFRKIVDAITQYRNEGNVEAFIAHLEHIFVSKHNLRYMIQGIIPYIRNEDQDNFNAFWEKFR